MTRLLPIAAVAVGLAMAPAAPPEKKTPQPYRLPGVEKMPQVLWGSECQSPDGFALSFGGEDTKADDGIAHTAVKTDGQWTAILDQLRAGNPLQQAHDRLCALRGKLKETGARVRFIYFEGLPADSQARAVAADVLPALRKVADELASARADLKVLQQPDRERLVPYHHEQVALALSHLASAEALVKPVFDRLAAGVSADDIKAMQQGQERVECSAEVLDAEPAARALSPIAYDAKTKLFILFGGDHLDYLTNDTWVFDPSKKVWRQRHPKSAPPPRANHKLTAAGDGKVKLTGG